MLLLLDCYQLDKEWQHQHNLWSSYFYDLVSTPEKTLPPCNSFFLESAYQDILIASPRLKIFHEKSEMNLINKRRLNTDI